MKQDAIIANVFRCLQCDMNVMDEMTLQPEDQEVPREEVLRFRDVGLVDDGDSYAFKQAYQLSAFLKRYRFDNDLFTDAQLELASEEKFLAGQERLRSLDLTAITPWAKGILSRSKVWIKSVLGEYDAEYVQTHGRFSTKTTVGVKLRDAAEAKRWHIPMTGSAQHVNDFASALSEDELAYIGAQSPDESLWFHMPDALKLVFVPKTHKSLRAIMPNTSIGSRQTDGQGKLLRERLRGSGIDLASLQERNKELARRGSIDGTLVTVDQSAASDNITVDLVKLLLPSDWFENLSRGRIGTYTLPSGARVENSPTFGTMGIGFTFPLQTLIFQSLVEGLSMGLRWPRGVVSVYGDDMIFGREYYPFFKLLCRDIGLEVNVEKTYTEGPFRESCGGDYYRGLDVRPFSPERLDGCEVCGKRLESFLYKLLNGFLRRWHHLEIPTVVSYLTRLLSTLPSVNVVPPSYGDRSGIKWGSPEAPFGLTNCKPIRRDRNGNFRFYVNGDVGMEVHVPDELPLYWRRLSDMAISQQAHMSPHSSTRERIEFITGVAQERVGGLKRTKQLCPLGKPIVVRIRGRKAFKKITVAMTGQMIRIHRELHTSIRWT